MVMSMKNYMEVMNTFVRPGDHVIIVTTLSLDGYIAQYFAETSMRYFFPHLLYITVRLWYSIKEPVYKQPTEEFLVKKKNHFTDLDLFFYSIITSKKSKMIFAKISEQLLLLVQDAVTFTRLARPSSRRSTVWSARRATPLFLPSAPGEERR